MFQTKVLATAVAALVASTHVVEAETREERTQNREEGKDEFQFADCKLDDVPDIENELLQFIKMTNSQDDDLEQEADEDDHEDSFFKVTFKQNQIC